MAIKNVMAFDCKKAFLPVDFVICSSTQVMKANEIHEKAWHSIRAHLNQAQKKSLLDDQRQWLKTFPPTCGIPSSGKPLSIISPDSQQCVLKALVSRTEYLNNYIYSSNNDKPPTLDDNILNRTYSPKVKGDDNPVSLCDAISELALSIMRGRQSGVAMSRMMQIVEDNELSQSLIISAFELNRYSSEEYQTRAAEDFRDAVHLQCIKARRATQ